MKYTNPFYYSMEDPFGEIPFGEDSLPVMRIPNRILTKRLHDQPIDLYALCAFFASPGNGKAVIAKHWVETALANGTVKPGDEIVEPTSGGTGAALAYYGGKHGIRVVTIVSDDLEVGKMRALARQGANVFTESKATAFLGLEQSPGSQELARLYAEKTGAVFPDQYHGDWNPQAWRQFAPLVWDLFEQKGVRLTEAFFTLGSTGTMRGLGGYLKEKGVTVVATRPFIGQKIAGTRDEDGLRQVAHWEDIPTYVDETDYAVAEKHMDRLFRIACIPGGESSGAAVGIADHYYLKYGTNPAGRSVGLMIFMDTFAPYVRGE